MAKVLVVGGAGYVGGFLTSSLLLAGHTVKIIDNLTYEESYLKNVDFIYGDIRNMEPLKKHIQWADCIIWLAAIVGDSACALNSELTRKINIDSLKILVGMTDSRIIFPSTCSVYGAQSGTLTEESETKPLSLYAESKLEAEKILLSSKSQVLIFRLGTLFGISDEFSRIRTDLVLNFLTIRACLEKKMVVFGGQQYRPLLHVKDFSTAAIPHITTNLTGIFNIHFENLAIYELAKKINSFVPDSVIDITEMTFQDSRNYRVSSSKAKEILEFDPIYSVDFGINEIIKIISERRIVNFDNPRFTNSHYLKLQHGVS
jgi:nucleoside-diphosphate-sugar epimerase